ncbi:D-alanyl-D-alanine carboxypeptidase/D-alanyl-D-alanine endopeptidase [Nakamurella antarctica]|uniref:D-alanyl-D-alanine carboxypeptidase/D-alanyl-D-alanine endopeptidase n=1 Tax=Nakamurella antarctica TaxID=1902245 RepID=UPI0013DDEA5B|nr:D-alanyl-D-alanine carboxypeptidase/D-alanyl-D-alanine-endopeptidase [Nakamurella antarctica]
MATNRSGSRRGLIIGLVLVLVVALGAGAYFVFFRSSGEADVANSTSTTSVNPNENGAIDPLVLAKGVQITPVTPGPAAPSAAGVGAALAGPIGALAPAQFNGIIIDAATDTTLLDTNAAAPQIPASTAKLLTGAAVLTSLEPQAVLTTKVVQGSAPGAIVLVGGGDVTLSARKGQETMYPGAASMTDLATQIKAAGITVTKIETDTTRWGSDELAEGWLAADIGDASNPGDITHMSPIMVDGDRIKSGINHSGRTGDPTNAAAKALAVALGNPAIAITTGITADPSAAVLASVTSQPISVLLAQALENSDNILAEALGREVAIKEGAPATFGGAVSAITLKLQQLGLDTAGMVLADASGISNSDRVPPRLLAQVLALAVKSGDTNLRDLVVGIPIAGATGTLSDRFKAGTASEAARGWLRAKTGSLNATYALAGVVPGADGRIFVFAFSVNNVNGETTRPAMDAVAATLRGCGCA